MTRRAPGETGAIKLTKQERRAVASLQALAKRWPRTLQLFSWSGTLHVFKPGDGRTNAEASAAIVDIPNGGGDPPAYEEC